MTLLRSHFWTFGLGTPVKKTLVSSHWVTGVSETEGLQNSKINPLHQKHKKCLTIPHSCSFALFASLLPALFLLFSTSTCLPSPLLLPLPHPSSSDLRKIGTWEHFESISLLWSSKDKHLLRLFPPFSQVSGEERGGRWGNRGCGVVKIYFLIINHLINSRETRKLHVA